MTQSLPRFLFGIHSILFVKRSDKTPYGAPIKVLKSGGIEMSADFEDLTGGSEKFVVASEAKLITTELKFTTNDYQNFLFELFLGGTVTKNAAEALGSVNGLANVAGSSMVSATGIASVSVLAGSEANLKFGKVIVVAKSATEVNLVWSSDIDFDRGVDAAYQNDAGEVLAADVALVAGGDLDIADLGLKITGDVGPVALTVGDTAEFHVRPANDESSNISVGSSNTTFPAFGAFLYTQKRNTQEYFEVEIFNATGAGLPLLAEEKVWSGAELTIKVLKDFAQDKIFDIRHMTAD